MHRLALKSVLDNKLRYAFTAVAIVVGVAFVVAAFVVADSLRSTFDKLGADINTGVDFTVRGKLPFGEITEATAASVPESLRDDVLAVDGVSAAEGVFFVPGVIPVDGSGRPPSTFGAPIAGTNWTEDESLSQLFLITGEWPIGASEFAIDAVTFADHDFKLGGDYSVVTPTGPRMFTLTGTMQFGFPENAGLGAVFSVFDTATAQEVLGFDGQFNQISARAEPGADIETVRAQIEAVLPPTVEIVTSEEAANEFGNAFESFLGPFQNILLAFAGIVLFVSLFIIYNTFNIVIGQRVRDLSLLRAVGATPQQVRWSVLAESVVIGAAATAAGLALGMLGALGIRALFSVFGGQLPDGPLPLSPRTVVWAVVVGVGVTISASFIPAVKASRISPVAGLRDDEGAGRGRRSPLRPVVGGALASLGLLLAWRGLFADFNSTTAQLLTLAAGTAVVFLAVAVLSSLIAGPVVSALACPLGRAFGTPGRLARDNAARNPRRTAATAASLTVGLALVSMVSVVGQSLKDTFVDNLTMAVEADYIVSDGSGSGSGLPKTLARDLRAAGVGSVVSFSSDLVQISSTGDTPGTDVTSVTVTDLSDIEDVANLDVVDGSLSGFNPAEVLFVHTDTADDWGLRVGDAVQLQFVSSDPAAVGANEASPVGRLRTHRHHPGDAATLEVGAVYEQDAFWGDWLIDGSLHGGFATNASDDAVAVRAAIDDPATARAMIEEALADYPQAQLEDRQEFQRSAESNLNTILAMINVFLLFALVVALVGIVNTLTLSVFERTREIGLLRAVGMTRRQLRRTIRWEAATIALYGALLGVILGLTFGVAASVAIPDSIVDRVSVPATQVVGLIVIAVVFGLAAAIFPAYRAARMNILEAIHSD